MADETETTGAPDPPPFGAGERAVAAVMLCGSLALAYVCVDVLAGGRITRTLTGGPS